MPTIAIHPAVRCAAPRPVVVEDDGAGIGRVAVASGRIATPPGTRLSRGRLAVGSGAPRSVASAVAHHASSTAAARSRAAPAYGALPARRSRHTASPGSGASGSRSITSAVNPPRARRAVTRSPGRNVAGIAQHVAAGVRDDGIAALQRRERTDGVQRAQREIDAAPSLADPTARGDDRRRVAASSRSRSAATRSSGEARSSRACAAAWRAAITLQPRSDRESQPRVEFVEPLRVLAQHRAGVGPREALLAQLQRLALVGQPPSHRERQAARRGAERRAATRRGPAPRAPPPRTGSARARRRRGPRS